jgi:hypothetical protein
VKEVAEGTRLRYGDDGRRVAGPDRRWHVVDLVEGTPTPRSTREEWTYDGRKLELAAGYDPTTGTLSWYKDAAGRQTSFHYNPLLQLSSIVRAGDSDAKPTVAFDYLCGNPLSQIVARSRARLSKQVRRSRCAHSPRSPIRPSRRARCRSWE